MPTRDDPNFIIVGKTTDDKRAIWDRHSQHPSNYGQPAGEVFISDMRPYEVYRSPGIMQKMGPEGMLKELSERDQRSRSADYEKAESEREEVRRTAREQAQPNAAMVMPAPSQAQPLAGGEGANAGEPVETDDEDEDDEESGPKSTSPRVRPPTRRNPSQKDGEAPPER